MALINCPECDAAVSDRAHMCPHCGYPLDEDRHASPAGDHEEILLEESPAMFGNHPFWFSLCLALSLVVVGLVILLIWRARCRGVVLTVTNKRTTLRTGIFSRTTNEIRHADVRDLIVHQGFFQRMMGVGALEISSAAHDDGDILIEGLNDPEGVADLIREHQ